MNKFKKSSIVKNVLKNMRIYFYIKILSQFELTFKNKTL